MSGPSESEERLERALRGEPAGDPGTSSLVVLARTLSERWSGSPDPATFARIRARSLAAYGAAGVRPRRRPAVALATAAALVLMSGTALAGSRAVAASLPGDRLYAVKLAFESVRLAVARGPTAEAMAFLETAEARVEEMVRAEATGRLEAIPELAARYADALAGYGRAVAAVPGRELGDVVLLARTELDVHRRVLAELLGVLPEPARAGIEQAVEASSRFAGGAPGGAGIPSRAPVAAPPPAGDTAGAATDAPAGLAGEAEDARGRRATDPYPTGAPIALPGGGSIEGGDATCADGSVSPSQPRHSCWREGHPSPPLRPPAPGP